MKTEKLEQSYKEQLIRTGVDPHRAAQAAKTLTWDELQFISDIWPEWAATCSRTEREIVTIEL